MIDAHVHLWEKQRGRVNDLPVYDLGGGKSMFGADIILFLNISSLTLKGLKRLGYF